MNTLLEILNKTLGDIWSIGTRFQAIIVSSEHPKVTQGIVFFMLVLTSDHQTLQSIQVQMGALIMTQLKASASSNL